MVASLVNRKESRTPRVAALNLCLRHLVIVFAFEPDVKVVQAVFWVGHAGACQSDWEHHHQTWLLQRQPLATLHLAVERLRPPRRAVGLAQLYCAIAFPSYVPLLSEPLEALLHRLR